MTSLPRVPMLDKGRIPPLLAGLSRWVAWRAGPIKPSGKFDKVPINAMTGLPCNANEPSNWVSYGDACAAYDRNQCSGIGIVLSAQPASRVNAQSLYLVALDLDQCKDRMDACRNLWKWLGRPYVEVSPSGAGLRMLALSDDLIKGGNAGSGRELYSTGRFVTITGNAGHGELVHATEKLRQLERAWFPPKAVPRRMPPMLSHLVSRKQPEMRANVERVKAQLACVSPDCTYEVWRNIVWAVLSTDWKCAEDLARTWSLGAPSRFDARSFDRVCRSFDQARGINLGTLVHHAKQGGWK